MLSIIYNVNIINNFAKRRKKAKKVKVQMECNLRIIKWNYLALNNN